MKRLIINLLFLFILLSNVALAELNQRMLERLNEDYNKIYQLRDAAQPRRKSIEVLVEEKNNAFAELVKKRVTKNELEVIKKDLDSTSISNSAQIEKDYIERLDSTKNEELAEENQDILSNIISASQDRLVKGVELASISKNKNENAVVKKINVLPSTIQPSSSREKDENAIIKKTISAKEIEETETKRIQIEALKFSKSDKRKLTSRENDSLFKKVSKAYQRNLEKIIVEEVDP